MLIEFLFYRKKLKLYLSKILRCKKGMPIGIPFKKKYDKIGINPICESIILNVV